MSDSNSSPWAAIYPTENMRRADNDKTQLVVVMLKELIADVKKAFPEGWQGPMDLYIRAHSPSLRTVTNLADAFAEVCRAAEHVHNGIGIKIMLGHPGAAFPDEALLDVDAARNRNLVDCDRVRFGSPPGLVNA